MADWRNEEYKDYWALCEELNLVHKFKAGDWFYEHTPKMVVSSSGVARVACWSYEYRYIEEDLGQWWFWLPSVSDWMEMLEKLGSVHIRLSKGKRDAQWLADSWSEPDVLAWGKTREEAMGRLWMAVVKSLKQEGDKEANKQSKNRKASKVEGGVGAPLVAKIRATRKGLERS